MALQSGSAGCGKVGDDEIGAGRYFIRRVFGVAYGEPRRFQRAPGGQPHRGVAVDDVDRDHGRP
ncbi:MAG TPA: hypothetical protein VME45_06730 [Stellaceae bacterium]|nr:hypothetical protein [Stellaceae bacterium]